MTKSFVVDFIQLAASGNCSAEFNSDVFQKAVDLMRQCDDDDNSISDFEDVTPFLKANGCSAADVFETEVTEETEDAFAAYVCYSL